VATVERGRPIGFERGSAAKAICDELRRNRYVLSYLPRSVVASEPRRLLVVGEKGIVARSKTMQPPD